MTVTQYRDVILREFEESDIPKKIEWINNPENNPYLHYDLPLETDKTAAWFRSRDTSKRLDCIIVYQGFPVGLIGLLQIDRTNREAEYYITIGETDFKHRGIGTKATRAILAYAFGKLELRRVFLTVDTENKNAIGLYEKVGFRRESRFTEDRFFAKTGKIIERERYAISAVCRYFE